MRDRRFDVALFVDDERRSGCGGGARSGREGRLVCWAKQPRRAGELAAWRAFLTHFLHVLMAPLLSMVDAPRGLDAGQSIARGLPGSCFVLALVRSGKSAVNDK